MCACGYSHVHSLVPGRDRASLHGDVCVSAVAARSETAWSKCRICRCFSNVPGRNAARENTSVGVVKQTIIFSDSPDPDLLPIQLPLLQPVPAIHLLAALFQHVLPACHK